MNARLDWHPDGRRLLALRDGVVTLGDERAFTDVLDARFDPDGQVVTVARASPRMTCAALAAEARAHAAFEDPVVRAPGYTFTLGDLGVGNEGTVSMALSADARLLAIAWETRAWDDGTYRRASGRGFVVLDLAPVRHARVPRIVDRAYHECVRDPGPTALAFDRRKRPRLAIATPDAGAAHGVIRVGAGDRYPRTRRGGARAVALDDRGVVAAYAYPRGVGERLVGVEYLAVEARGEPAVAVRDTLWIEPALDDVVALAFDRTGRRIACLAASGAIDVIPVP